MLIANLVNARRAGISKTKGSYSIVDHMAQMPHDPDKVRIVGRMRDGEMEVYCGMRGDLPIPGSLFNTLQRLLQGIKLSFGAMGRCQGRRPRFNFDS